MMMGKDNMYEFELNRTNRVILGRAFRYVKRVDIGIDSVIEGQMGKAFVDDLTTPAAFQLRIEPFCYLAGNFESGSAVVMVKELEPYRLVMTCPNCAVKIAESYFSKRFVRFPRTSFSSESLSIDHVSSLLENSPFRTRLSRIDRELLAQLSDGQDHFLDISAYESIGDFLSRGIGYYLTLNDRLAGVAYSSLVSNTGIEVSIYVEPDYRRQGVATALGCALVRECLKRNIDPHWDAANAESCTLAEQIGYVRAGVYSSYYVKE